MIISEKHKQILEIWTVLQSQQRYYPITHTVSLTKTITSNTQNLPAGEHSMWTLLFRFVLYRDVNVNSLASPAV